MGIMEIKINKRIWYNPNPPTVSMILSNETEVIFSYVMFVVVMNCNV